MLFPKARHQKRAVTGTMGCQLRNHLRGRRRSYCITCEPRNGHINTPAVGKSGGQGNLSKMSGVAL